MSEESKNSKGPTEDRHAIFLLRRMGKGVNTFKMTAHFQAPSVQAFFVLFEAFPLFYSHIFPL